MKIISGIECVRIISKEKGLSVNVDNLHTTQHDVRYKEDFALAKSVGISLLRIGVPWNRIEPIRGQYNWDWFDAYMNTLRTFNIEPILDPLHHVTIPSWLEGGFLNPQFSSVYALFFYNILNRYPWVKKYTIVNEPLVTTYFSTEIGTWYPFETGRFKQGLNNITKIFETCGFMLEIHDKEHWYIDAAEYHYGTCHSSSLHAVEKNKWRFTMLDTLLRKGVKIDTLGLDYYAHCEFEWCTQGRNETSAPIGLAKVVEQYRDRYNLPIVMTETNIRGYTTDRQNWLKHILKECKKANIDTLCWYPFIDSTDWDTLVTQPNYNIDPQGLIYLDANFNRHTSHLTDTVRFINEGGNIDDIEEFPYQPPLDNQLKGFVWLSNQEK